MNTIAVIGGGPAGYVAAIKAAQKGCNVILIEENSLGGVCLNEGCIRTKAMLRTANTFHAMKNSAYFGIELDTENVSVNWEAAQEYQKSVVNKLVEGITYLLKKNNIQFHKGKASFITPNLLRIIREGEMELLVANKIIIATGSSPISLPTHPFGGKWILNSTQILKLSKKPESLLIIGGGVIGCEFASIFARLGTEVTVVEKEERILPDEDPDISDILQKELETEGVMFYTNSTVKLQEVEKTATIESDGKEFSLKPEIILVSIGRKPRIDKLSLEDIGVNYSHKGIVVDEMMRTSISHIYACGDVTGGLKLAHVAIQEGTIAALNACGEESKLDYQVIPRCLYSIPEIASVGLTEAQARKKYGEILIGEYPFSANSKALLMNEGKGKVKVLVEPKYHEIIGISIVGPNAIELIGQASMMLTAELTADHFEYSMCAHPSLSEAVYEAFLQVFGDPLHLFEE